MIQRLKTSSKNVTKRELSFAQNEIKSFSSSEGGHSSNTGKRHLFDIM